MPTVVELLRTTLAHSTLQPSKTNAGRDSGPEWGGEEENILGFHLEKHIQNLN